MACELTSCLSLDEWMCDAKRLLCWQCNPQVDESFAGGSVMASGWWCLEHRTRSAARLSSVFITWAGWADQLFLRCLACFSIHVALPIVLGVQILQYSRFDFTETRCIMWSFSLVSDRGLWSELHTDLNKEECVRLHHIEWVIYSQRVRLMELTVGIRTTFTKTLWTTKVTVFRHDTLCS